MRGAAGLRFRTHEDYGPLAGKRAAGPLSSQCSIREGERVKVLDSGGSYQRGSSNNFHIKQDDSELLGRGSAKCEELLNEGTKLSAEGRRKENGRRKR